MPYFYKKRANGSLIVGSQLVGGKPHFQCDTDIPETDLKHMVNAGNVHDDLVAVAKDFHDVLQERGMFCECGEPDCRTTRLRAALAKVSAA